MMRDPARTVPEPVTTPLVAVLAFAGIVVSLMETVVVPLVPRLPGRFDLGCWSS